MRVTKLHLLGLCLFISQPVWALRCGHELIELGYTKQEVFDKCGDPESIDTHVERRATGSFIGSSQFSNQAVPNSALNYGQQIYGEVDVVVDEWIYDFGRRRLQQYLRFENGRLRDIQTLSRGR